MAECGPKHAKLAFVIIGLVLLGCIGISMTLGQMYAAPAAGLEPRLREAEKTLPAIDVKLDEMQKSLDRLEKRLEALDRPEKKGTP